jgi:hypothetical protein
MKFIAQEVRKQVTQPFNINIKIVYMNIRGVRNKNRECSSSKVTCKYAFPSPDMLIAIFNPCFSLTFTVLQKEIP